MKYSDEFLKGWAAAREQYQMVGGVAPYPPGYYTEGDVGGASESREDEPPKGPPIPTTG